MPVFLRRRSFRRLFSSPYLRRLYGRTDHDTAGTPACRRAVRSSGDAGRQQARSAGRSADQSRACGARRMRFMRWCRPYWSRTKPCATRMPAFANSKAAGAGAPAKAAFSTICATLSGPAREGRPRCHRSAGGRRLRPGNAARAGAAPAQAPPSSGGGSFLGTAAASAAGVIGGALLLNSLPRRCSAAAASSNRACSINGGGQSTPWGGGNAANSDLAREAGVNEIGRGGRDTVDDTAIDRAGLFDTATERNRQRRFRTMTETMAISISAAIPTSPEAH